MKTAGKILAATCGVVLLSSSTGFAEYTEDTKNVINSKSVLDNNSAVGSNSGIITTSETSDNKIGENITYTLNDEGTLTISGTGEMYDYKSDGSVNDVDSPFHCSEEIKSVVIENGVTNIGNSVFHTCKNLERVEIPESVTAINYRAFANCEKLNSITLPDNLTYIGAWAFEKCGGLTDIIIPDSVVTIDKYAFTECNGLTKMTIPAGVKLQYEAPNLNGAIFYKCKGLKEVTLYNDRITPSMFYYCDALETVNIEGEVGIINSYAFNYCNRLKKINLPESIYKIDTGAFTGCLSLEEIIIPDNVTVIKQWCFRQCSGLKSIVIPQNVTSVEMAPFDGCNSLETVFYPYNLDLTNASIPNTATKLSYKIENGEMTITDITLGNEKNEVEIHDTVNGIPVVFVEESVRDKVAENGHTHKRNDTGYCVICTQKSDFDYTVLDNGEIRITKCYINDRTEVVIPGTIEGKYVTSISGFTDSGVIEKVIIPNTVKEIYGVGVFEDMTGLKEVCFDGFSEGRVVLSQRTFPSNLERIVFPEGLTDQDIKDKMGLEFFPADAKLYSGTELLPHNYEYAFEQDGLQHYLKCTACDDIENDSYEDHSAEGDFITDNPDYNYQECHYQKCKCGLIMGILHTSDKGTETIAPGYDSEGKKEYRCTVCGYLIKEETLAPLEHNIEDEWQSDSSGHWHNCGCGEKHNFGEHISDGGKVTLEPDYDSEGRKEYRCTVCGYLIKEETLAPLEHNIEDEWQSDSSGHWHNCGCGEKHNFGEHISDGGKVTLEPDYDSEGKKEYRCTVCGYLIKEEILAPLEHNIEEEWQSDSSGHWHNCGCGEKHNFGEHISDGGKVTLEPDYDSEGKKEYRCTVCGYLIKEEILAPLEHNIENEWQSDSSGHWHNCGCGEKHNFGEHISDGGKVTLEPDYDSEGKKEYRCTVCGYLIKEETLALLEHNIEDEWQSDESGHWHNCGCGEKHNFGEHISDGGSVTIQPTYDLSGERVFSCTACGYIMKTEAIPALKDGEDDTTAPPIYPDKPDDPGKPDDNPGTGESGRLLDVIFFCSIAAAVETVILKNRKKKTK